jgi:voltage-gated potassium channel
MGGPLLAAAVVVVISTAGYVVLAGLPWFDALYMTFITVGTVGFSEIGELGTAGRAWTMAVIFAGYAVLVVMTARLTAMLLSGAWAELLSARRRQRLMTTLEGHTIIVGFGRVGEATAESFVGAGRSSVTQGMPRCCSWPGWNVRQPWSGPFPTSTTS